MKKKFIYVSVFSIGLIFLSGVGAIERTFDNNVNDVAYQEAPYNESTQSSRSNTPATLVSVIDFTVSNITSTSATFDWNLDMGEAQSIEKIELSYNDPTNGPQTVDTELVSTTGSYELNGLTPDTNYDMTLIVTWTNALSMQETTSSDVINFTTLAAVGVSVADFSATEDTNTSEMLSWNLDMGDAQTIDKIEISDTANGIPLTDTESTSPIGSYTLEGLTANTTYNVTLTVSWTDFFGVSQTTTSDVVSFTTLNKADLSVIDFTTSDITKTEATLSWNLDMGDASSIEKIEISDTANGIPITDTGSTSPSGSYTLTDLTPSTLYNVTLTVTWIDFFGEQQITTDEVSFTTLDPADLSIINFYAVEDTNTSERLDWQLNMGDAESIEKIEISYDDHVNGLQTVDTGSVLQIGFYTLTDLTQNTTYDANLIVSWTDYYGDPQTTTNGLSFTTANKEDLSVADFSSFEDTDTSEYLSWNLNMGDAQTIDKIEISDTANGIPLTDTESTSNNDIYLLTGLTPSTTYDITLTVTWTDYFGNQQTTTDVETFTTSDPVDLSVTEFIANDITETSAILSWDLDMGEATSIEKIELSYDDPTNGFQTIDTESVLPSDSYTLTDLTPGTSYNVTISVTWTDYFGTSQITTSGTNFATLDPVDLSVTDFSASDLTQTSATLSWDLDMGEATSIEKIELSYDDPTNGFQTIDTGSVLPSDSYTLTDLTPNTMYDVTLTVSWTDYFGDTQVTTDVENFTTPDQVALSVTEFITTDVNDTSATLSWKIDMGDAESIDSIELSYEDPISGNQLVDTGSVEAEDSYTLTDLVADSSYNVTLIVTWTDFFGAQQTTNSDVSFSTSYEELEIISTNIQANESTNQAVVSWVIEENDSVIDDIIVTNSSGVVIASGSTDAIGSYTIDSSDQTDYNWSISVTYSSPSGTQTTSNETITDVVVSSDPANDVTAEIIGGVFGILFIIAIIILIYLISNRSKAAKALETSEARNDVEGYNEEYNNYEEELEVKENLTEPHDQTQSDIDNSIFEEPAKLSNTEVENKLNVENSIIDENYL